MTQPANVSIIYNPHSTGDSKKNAEVFYRACKKAGIAAKIIATEHAGHAYELAKELAGSKQLQMIVSSSGDGGYHEVVNGVLDSDRPDTIVGVLPSGNANDHYHFVHSGNVISRIKQADSKLIDVIRVETPDWTRYAHSYVGMGATPQIGAELTKHTLNRVKETIIVLVQFFRVHPVKLRVNGRVRRYDHIVFSNIGQMSKYLTLSKDAQIDDGYFEIATNRHTTVLGLLRHFVRAVMSEANTQKAAEYRFVVGRGTTIQLDGEVYDLKAGDEVTVRCMNRAFRCIV